MPEAAAKSAINIKDAVTGLLVILSLIGGLYGSLKPETDARESHQVLAPIVDEMALRLAEQERQLVAVEAKHEVYQELFVSMFKDSLDKQALAEMIMLKEKPAAVLAPEPEHDEQHQHQHMKPARPKMQRRKVSWEK